MHADVPAWLRFTIDQADLVASDKLKPAQVAELKRQEAARAAGRPVQEPAQQPAGVTGPSKAKRQARQTVSYQVPALARPSCKASTPHFFGRGASHSRGRRS